MVGLNGWSGYYGMGNVGVDHGFICVGSRSGYISRAAI